MVWISSRGPITLRRPCARTSETLGYAPRRRAGERGAGLRSPAISNSPGIPRGQRRSPALAALIEAVKDNPTEKQLIEETKALVERQIAVNGELIGLRTAGDSAAVAALVSQEDRAATAAIAGNLEKAVAEERRLLFARRADRNQRDASCWRSISPASR